MNITQLRLWSSDSDLSLRWAHSHFVGFVMKRLKLFLATASVTFLKSVIEIK